MGRRSFFHDHERNANKRRWSNIKLLEDGHVYNFENHDVSDIITIDTFWDRVNKHTHMGHFFYRKRFDELIDFINFEL